MIIAFTGKKGHGKDTAAEFLIKNYQFVKIGFADPVRKLCQQIYFLTDEEISDPTLKETKLTRWPYKSPRHLMQELAQFFRDKYPEVWVVNWARRAEQALIEGAHNIVCTDLRYLNEEEMLKGSGALIVRVINPRVLPNEYSQHKSETEMDQIYPWWQICNDSDIPALHKHVREMYDNARSQS